MKNNQNTEEFVTNPSKITEHLAGIVLKLNNEFEKKYKSGKFLGKFVNDCKFLWYLKEGRNDYYSFLNNYEIPEFGKEGVEKIELLFKEFEKIYSKLILNNHALAYAYIKEKKLSNSVLTMEDKKMLYLKKLSDGEITVDQFNRKFGHYALNAYELSAKRFEEYSTEELKQIAKLASKIEIKNKIELEECLEKKPDDAIPILIALRELAKYQTLFLVRGLRYELKKLAKKKAVEDIFNKSYQEVISL